MMPSLTPSFNPVATNNHDQDTADASTGAIELSESTTSKRNGMTAEHEDDGGPSSFIQSTSSSNAAAASAVEQELSGDDHVVSSASHHSSLLTMRQAAALLTADCLGTGLLALPQNVWVLGRTVGLGFLVLNLPVNWYAGALLSRAALHVEEAQQEVNEADDSNGNNNNSILGDNTNDGVQTARDGGRDGIMRKRSRRIRTGPSYSTIQQQNSTDHDDVVEGHRSISKNGTDIGDGEDRTSEQSFATSAEAAQDDDDDARSHSHHDIKTNAIAAGGDSEELEPTHDYIALTRCLFPHPRATQYQPRATHLVIAVFFTNIFLVLGDYILVMSHAVAALLEDHICLPWAGVLASTLMFGLSQLRTMASLGHSVTALSLASLAVVVVQCLVADQEHAHDPSYVPPYAARPGDSTMIRKLSALASIMFATGPNKLVLNIRNEMKQKEECPQTLGLAVTIYGVVYVTIVLLAGPNPPSFLFDSIPEGTSRQIAGLLLWAHVAVSYAINSQAICSSIDRLFLQNIQAYNLQYHPRRRWFLMTLALSLSSYFVANAVPFFKDSLGNKQSLDILTSHLFHLTPFFKDLLALIGALTSVPLALTLPVVLHRRVWNIPIWVPTMHSLASYAILMFSLVFLFVGLVGACGSIKLDWAQQGTPFACTV